MLNIFTIVLDGNPWIGAQFAELVRLGDSLDWHWSIVEGASKPVKDTRWMNDQSSKVSHDGTHQFLKALALHPRISVQSKPEWAGKTEMINAALTAFKEDGILLQMDSDEIWTKDQLIKLVDIFVEDSLINTVMVKMQYMVGPNVVTTSNNGYGNKSDEWVRAWRYKVGLWMECHEPPVFNSNSGNTLDRETSAAILGEILHMSWVSPTQVSQKQRIYGDKYSSACEGWWALQNNKDWPVKDLRKFLPWTGPNSSADQLLK